LKRIDDSRIYSNFGPLNAEYQTRLAELFEAPVVTGSSATSLITATLMAYDLPKGSLVAMPSWTFPATAAAVVAAGLQPFFVDVCEKRNIMRSNTNCSAMLYVSPLGSPFETEVVDKLSEETGIPILIDAAAGFDTFSTVCKPKNIPVIVSTHATKAFGTGEGGFVTCHNTELLERIRKITNFGLTPSRDIEYNGLNAKFSEYHAAVGLAELDVWPEKRQRYLEKLKPYGIDYAVSQIASHEKFTDLGVKGLYGCHHHKAYENCPRTALPVTEDLIKYMRFVRIGS
jgi:dTDP-4-amino-4,6-dideoxygalactose transaminase